MTKQFPALALGILVCVAGCAHSKPLSPLWPNASVRTVADATGTMCSSYRIEDVNRVLNRLTVDDFTFGRVVHVVNVGLRGTRAGLKRETARELVVSLESPLAYPKQAGLDEAGKGVSRFVISAFTDHLGNTIEMMWFSLYVRGNEHFVPWEMHDDPFALSEQHC